MAKTASKSIGRAGDHLWTVEVWPMVRDGGLLLVCAAVMALAWGAWIFQALFIFVMFALYVTIPWAIGMHGERRVGRCLDDLHDAGFIVLHDVDVGFGNVDHVVVGPTGVFAVETKAWKGRVHVAAGRRLKVGDRDEEKTRGQAVSGAIKVRQMLAGAGFDRYVIAIIALAKSVLPKGRIQLHQADVVETKDLCERIRGRRHVLHRDEIERIAMKLAPMVSERKRRTDVFIELER